ncbi:MAG: hypothetical protein VB144_10415 [Clostridia bacterium]|nr:hypothetical protein [Clostridia bacterium]
MSAAAHLAIIGIALVLCLASRPVSAAATGAGPATPQLQIDGDVEFRLRGGWGDSAALAGSGYPVGSIDFAQLLSFNVTGRIAPGLSISGSLDNRKDGNLQVLEVTLDADPVKGKFGGLSFRTDSPYANYTARLRGFELRGVFPTAAAGITVGRVQGIAASKTFQGSTAAETIVYEPSGTYAPSPSPAAGGLGASLEGMEYYGLGTEFDADFMGVWLRYTDAVAPSEPRTLKQTLELWDVGYLYKDGPAGQGIIASGDAVSVGRGQYVAVSSTQQMLALRAEIRDILRGQVQSWIREYNSKNGLVGSAQKQYPFIYGSETESAFLEDLLARHGGIIAGTAPDASTLALDVPAGSYNRRRLYDLGQTDVAPGSVAVELRRAGQFLPADAEVSLSPLVFYDAGVIEFQFPPTFFSEYDGIRVRYRYSVAQGIFHLGISIAHGSEKVFLNGVALTRDRDYVIDYELGILTILRPLGAEDVVKVDYEYFRGPFGAAADYKSNFYGASLGWSPSDRLKLGLDVAVFADDPRSAAMPEATQTMPNLHGVAGLSGKYSDRALSLSVDLGISRDQFPFDDNRKLNAANRVWSVMAASDSDSVRHLIFAHQDGISVGPGVFRNYGVGSGLSAPAVHDMAADGDVWFFATEGGLTVFHATPGPGGQAPFDYASNWKRLYVSSGIPSTNVTSVATTPWDIWVGTDKGAATADLTDLETWTVYRKGGAAGLPSESVSDLAYDPLQDLLFVATDADVSSFTAGHFTTELAGVSAVAVISGTEAVGGARTFAIADGRVYARADSGVWAEVAGQADAPGAQALAVWNGCLWIGTADGVRMWDGAAVQAVASTRGFAVSSLGVGPGAGGGEALWAGTVATADYKVVLFEIAGLAVAVDHDGSDMEIPGKDPRRYVDIAAADHVVTGYAGRVNAKYNVGAGHLYGSYEKVQPEFARLGEAKRQGLDAWRLGVQLPVGSKLSLNGEHSQTAYETYPGALGVGEPKITHVVSSRVGGTLDIGPRLEASYVVSQIDESSTGDGFDREERTLSLMARQSIWQDRITLGAGYETTDSDNLLSPASSYAQVSLKGDASLKLDALTVSASYRKPVKTIAPGLPAERVAGTEELNLSAQWGAKLGPLTLRAYYRQVDRTDVATEKKLDDKRADLRATLPVLKLGSLSLTPSAVLKWEQTIPFSGQARRAIGAQTSLNGSVGQGRASAGASITRSDYPGIDKVSYDTETFITLSGAGNGVFVPQFDLRWKRSQAERADLGKSITDALTGSIRGVWTPRKGTMNTTSVVYTLTAAGGKAKHSLSLQDALSHSFSDRITATVDALARSSAPSIQALAGGSESDINAELKSGLRYKLTDMWSVGLALGYRARMAPGTSGDRFTGGFTAEASVRATF